MVVVVFGKAEGTGTNWHGHVTAVTVAPEFRRLALAEKLMNILEVCSDKVYVTIPSFTLLSLLLKLSLCCQISPLSPSVILFIHFQASRIFC